MRTIEIGRREHFTVIVSDDDYAFLRNWSWTFARSHPGSGELIYARLAVVVLEEVEGLKTLLKKRFDLFMHHVVLSRAGFPAPPVAGWTADHINHNTLDNRRENLRWASPSFQRKRQRHRNHPEFVRQALAGMLAEHTWPIVELGEAPPIAPSLMRAPVGAVSAEIPF